MKYVGYAALSLLSLLVLLLIWGVAVEPYIVDREEEVASIPNLPAAWEGPRAPYWATSRSGFVYNAPPDSSDEIGAVVELVCPIADAGIPAYAVLGNHDYALDPTDEPGETDRALAARVRQALEGIGIVVLHNEAIALPAPVDRGGVAPAVDGGPALHLVGIAPHKPGEARQVAGSASASCRSACSARRR